MVAPAQETGAEWEGPGWKRGCAVPGRAPRAVGPQEGLPGAGTACAGSSQALFPRPGRRLLGLLPEAHLPLGPPAFSSAPAGSTPEFSPGALCQRPGPPGAVGGRAAVGTERPQAELSQWTPLP